MEKHTDTQNKVLHDLNNVFGAIEGYSSIALNELSPENPIYHDIEMIITACQRGQELSKEISVLVRGCEEAYEKNNPY
jgi:hypothetical protein